MIAASFDASWSLISDCSESGKACGNNAEGKASCIEAQAEACVPGCKNGKVKQCGNDGKASIEECTDNKICGFDVSGHPACVSAPVVNVCTPMCKDGQLTICDEKQNATTTVCDADKVCGFDANGYPDCVAKPAAVVCAFQEGNLLIGSKACDNNGAVVECLADGTMSDGVACTEGVCVEGNCVRRACDDVAEGAGFMNEMSENLHLTCCIEKNGAPNGAPIVHIRG